MVHDLWLTDRNYVNAAKVISLIEHYGSAENVYNADLFEYNQFDLTPRQIASLADKDITGYDEVTERYITCYDERFPEKLLEIPTAPRRLFYRGDISLLKSKSVAIIGARNADYQANKLAFDFAKRIAEAKVTIVSGLARGIDASAHKGGINRTIGVLGCGTDIIYPEENAGLYAQMEEKGLIISEYLPKTPPIGDNFPSRNRIISALSEGVFVVICGERSGTMSTVNFARKIKKKVWTLPVSIGYVEGSGNIELMKTGAKTVFEPDDILKDLGESALPSVPADVPETTNPVLKALGAKPLNMDEIAVLTGMDIGKLNTELMMLELSGEVKRVAGKSFVRA